MNTTEVLAVITDAKRLILEASASMELAKIALTARDGLIAEYRRKDAKHECLIGALHKLLLEERTDVALDLVRAEYVSIHGPADGNAG